MSSENRYELIIVGAGPAGMTAAIYAVRSGLRTLLLEGEISGGTANMAPVVENYSGFESITGMELMNKMKSHASAYVDMHEMEPVTDIDIDENVSVSTDKSQYESDALLLCTGTIHQRLNIPGESELTGKGVSYCATCDGFFFKDKRVLMVGGGNTALSDAIYLLDVGCDVTLVHRRDTLRAQQSLQDRFFEKGGTVKWNSIVEEIRGDSSVKTVCIKNVVDDSVSEIEVDGVFIAVGEHPNSELAQKIGVKLDEGGYILVDQGQRTNLQRVYAAGDITGGVKQVIVACAEGCVAALSAYEDIRKPYWIR